MTRRCPKLPGRCAPGISWELSSSSFLQDDVGRAHIGGGLCRLWPLNPRGRGPELHIATRCLAVRAGVLCGGAWTRGEGLHTYRTVRYSARSVSTPPPSPSSAVDLSPLARWPARPGLRCGAGRAGPCWPWPRWPWPCCWPWPWPWPLGWLDAGPCWAVLDGPHRTAPHSCPVQHRTAVLSSTGTSTSARMRREASGPASCCTGAVRQLRVGTALYLAWRRRVTAHPAVRAGRQQQDELQ